MFAGGCATLVGVGLQRFAYAPLLPAMVRTGWLGPGAAGALAGVNFAGYLVGALLAGQVGRALGTARALRGCMLVAALCFALCAHRGGLGWFVPWRALAGAAGGVLMGLAGPAVQAAVPPARRGTAAGVVFGGVGLGIVLGAVLVPALLPSGLPAAWLALAVVALGLAAASWRCWPAGAVGGGTRPGHGGPGAPGPGSSPSFRPGSHDPRPHDAGSATSKPAARASGTSWPAGAGRLVLCYALAAAAATPMMVFWPDFVVRGLGRSAGLAGLLWAAYGLAAAAGPMLCGRVADRVGAGRALRATLVLQTLALAFPLVTQGTAALLLASLLAGGTAIGTTGLALTRARELAGDAAPGVWRLCTAAWAAAQLGSGFALAGLYAASGTHAPLFLAGMATSGLALLASGGTGGKRAAPAGP